MPTDPSELNLFDKIDPEMYVQQWFRQMLTYASTLAVSADRRHGLRDFPRTTAQLLAAGVVAPIQAPIVPELPNNASNGAVANHKALKEDADALARALQVLIEIGLRTGGVAFRAKHTDSTTGVLDVNMQQLCDDVIASYGTMLPRQLESLEAACAIYDPAIPFDGNAAQWTKNHEILRLNGAPINEIKKNSLLTTALSSRPEFREHIRHFLYSEPRDHHTYTLMLAYARRMNLLFPVAAAPTAHSFLAAAVADDSIVANAAMDARIKALEDGHKRGKRNKQKSPAAPAASTTAAVFDKNLTVCSSCKIWNRHDPIKYPDLFLWGKCPHNPKGVP